MAEPYRILITWEGTDGQVFFIEVDATTREQHGLRNAVTDHAVERGSNIADHVRPQPDQLTIDGVISNAPHYLPRDHTGGAVMASLDVEASWSGQDSRGIVEGRAPRLGSGFLDLIPIGAPVQAMVGIQTASGAVGATVQTFSAEFDRVRDVFDELQRLRNEGTLLAVLTYLRTYTDMAIESLDVTRDAGGLDQLAFTLSLKQVRFGTTATEPIPVLPVKRKDKGTVAPKPVTPAPDPNAVNPDSDQGSQSFINWYSESQDQSKRGL